MNAGLLPALEPRPVDAISGRDLRREYDNGAARLEALYALPNATLTEFAEQERLVPRLRLVGAEIRRRINMP